MFKKIFFTCAIMALVGAVHNSAANADNFRPPPYRPSPPRPMPPRPRPIPPRPRPIPAPPPRPMPPRPEPPPYRPVPPRPQPIPPRPRPIPPRPVPPPPYDPDPRPIGSYWACDAQDDNGNLYRAYDQFEDYAEQRALDYCNEYGWGCEIVNCVYY